MFDVDTAQVVSRVRKSIWPVRNQFLQDIKGRGDLYGARPIAARTLPWHAEYMAVAGRHVHCVSALCGGSGCARYMPSIMDRSNVTSPVIWRTQGRFGFVPRLFSRWQCVATWHTTRPPPRTNVRNGTTIFPKVSSKLYVPPTLDRQPPFEAVSLKLILLTTSVLPMEYTVSLAATVVYSYVTIVSESDCMNRDSNSLDGHLTSPSLDM